MADWYGRERGQAFYLEESCLEKYEFESWKEFESALLGRVGLEKQQEALQCFDWFQTPEGEDFWDCVMHGDSYHEDMVQASCVLARVFKLSLSLHKKEVDTEGEPYFLLENKKEKTTIIKGGATQEYLVITINNEVCEIFGPFSLNEAISFRDEARDVFNVEKVYLVPNRIVRGHHD